MPMAFLAWQGLIILVKYVRLIRNLHDVKRNTLALRLVISEPLVVRKS